MNKIIPFLFLLIYSLGYAQDNRIQQIKNNLDAIIPDVPGLSQKVDINIKETSLSNFLIAVSEVHKVNISVEPALSNISIINNFTDVTVSDLLVFLCKEYNLKIDFTGNIIAVKKYEVPIEIPKQKEIDVVYQIDNELLSLNLKEDKLYDVFKKIMDETGKNLVFSPGLENKLLTFYIKKTPFDNALNNMAFANNLSVTKTKDNFYLFENSDEETASLSSNSNNSKGNTQKPTKPTRHRKSNFFFTILDADKKLLEVDFENTPIANIIYDIGNELNIDVFISSPLESAGTATVKAKNITFDELLNKIFESKIGKSTAITTLNYQNQNQQSETATDNNSQDNFTYSKNNTIYYFGLKSQLLLRKVKSIPLMHRSIELLSDPTKQSFSSGRTLNQQNGNNYNSTTGGSNSNSNTNLNGTNNYNQQNSHSGTENSILSIFPDDVKMDLDIKIDRELNSFIVNGPATNMERFETFLQYIDKDVPVILIEVMLLEINKSATVETGITAGIGDKAATTTGTVFPNADINLGSQTINQIINHFDGFGSLNLGNVVPNFYLNLKALESNGNLKIRSAPRLSTLNGHRAYLSIGETTYYVVTNQNFFGSQIPQTAVTKNYQPIDAELSVTIKPLVSGDGQITLDIAVIQSSFNSQRVDKDAPPGLNSREFTSIIRVKDKDIVVLGGLEEKMKNDSGTGVPLLSRIPIIKWLFSSRKRTDSSKKLTVLIKPTVIY